MTLPTSTGTLFFLSCTTKMNGLSTVTSFWSPKEAENSSISTPVAAAPSVPSFVTWKWESKRLTNLSHLYNSFVLDATDGDGILSNLLQLGTLTKHLAMCSLSYESLFTLFTPSS